MKPMTRHLPGFVSDAIDDLIPILGVLIAQ